MSMADGCNLYGRFDIEIVNAATGRILRRLHVKNRLTEINRTVRAQMLMGSYTGALDALEIKSFAFGTDATAADPSQTSLFAEQFRKALTQKSLNGGNVTTVVSLQTNEANFIIREIGVFGGSDGTTMLARTVVNIDKNDSLVINITRSDICEI